MALFLKDPGARLDYHIDWSASLSAGGSIETSGWSAEPDGEGAVLVEDGGVAGLVTTAWISGGRAGRAYRVTNRVTLSDGGIDERTIVLRVEDR